MPEQLDEKAIAQYRKMAMILGGDETVTKSDLDAFAKKIIEIVLKMEQKNSQAIDDLRNTYATLLSSMENRHTSSLADLKGQTNQLFVGEKISGMIKEHAARMLATDKKLAEAEAKIRSMKDGLPGTRGERGFTGLTGPTGLLDEKALQALKDEMNKNVKDLIIKSKGGGGKKIVYSKTMDLSSQCGNGNKVFTLDERVLKVNYCQSSQFPFIYRKTVDWTATDLKVTLTSAVTAPEATQSFFVNVDLMFYSK